MQGNQKSNHALIALSSAVIESGFRPKSFPKEENLMQISKHEEDHDKKLEFAFTIVDVYVTICYRCIFIKPIVPFLKFAFFTDRLFENWDFEDNDPGVSFWVTPTSWKLSLYEKLLKELSKWFREEWVFKKWYLLCLRSSEEERKEIRKLKLKQKFLSQTEE